VSSDSAAEEAPVLTDIKVPDAPQRAAMRAAMRDEDPRARAARRAAELRGNLGDLDEGTDEFFIPPSMVPDGWTYEWKTKTVLGQENPAYQVALARKGWEPVPSERHPSMMPGGAIGAVERKGMILMERPKEITDEVRQIERKVARNQVRQKEEQLNSAPDGQFGRDHAQVRPKINKNYSPIAIPGDE
jgi:hypothetical protein